MKKTFIILSLIIVAASCARRHSEPITGSTVDYRNARIVHGHALYDQYCQKCHPSGEAGLGPDAVNKPGFARRFQVRHGLGVMPAFKKNVISKADLKDMMVYMNDLHRQK